MIIRMHLRKPTRVVLALLLTLSSSVAMAGLSAPATSGGNYTVSWTTTNSEGVQYLFETNNGNTVSYTVSQTATSKSFTGKSPGSYTYELAKTVCTYDPWIGTICAPQDSGYDPVTVQVGAPPTPGTISGPSSSYTGLYTLSGWGSVSGVQFKLQEKVNSGSWSTAFNVGSSWTPPSPKTNATYYYRVQACNGAGCSSFSAIKSVLVVRTPGVPPNFSAPATNVPGTQIISWSAASGSVSKYKFERSTNGGSTWTNPQNNLSYSFTEPGVANGTYWYRVSACNSLSCSSPTAVKSTQVMNAPATPGAISGPSNSTNGDYGLVWTASSGQLTHRLQEKVNSGTFTTIFETTDASELPGGSWLAGNNLVGKNDATYGYRVQVCHTGAMWSCSGWTSTKSVLVLKKPGVPSSFNVPSTDDDGTYSVTWGPSSGTVDSYDLQENSTIQNIEETYNLISGKAEGSYSYRVRGCNALSCSDWTATKTVQVAFPPGVPGSINTPATSIDGIYTVTWGPANGSASTYKLEQSVDGGVNWTMLQNTSAQFHGPTNNSVGRYDYRVRACNSVGVCADPTSTATTYVAPAAPTSVSSDEGTSIYGETDFSLSWPASTGAQTYQVQEMVEPDPWGGHTTTSSTSLSLVDVASGTYRYRVRACLQNACSTYSPEIEIWVFKLERLADPAPIVSPDAAGSMAYNANVAGSGDAVIRIPINAMPGVNDLAPNLALTYSSGGARAIRDAKRESGLLGYGWSVSGLSAIRRCRIGTGGDVDMTSSDRLCLDGQPLLLVSGTGYWTEGAEYRTERQSMVKIFHRVTNGEVWFEAFMPDGSRAVYGGTEGSTATAFLASSPYLWSVTLIEDAFDNQMTANYFFDWTKGTNYPLHIDYDGARIDFFYQMRDDTTALTYGGNEYVSNNATRKVALNRIEVSMEGVPVREYRLDHQLDAGSSYLRLEQLQLCAYDETGSTFDCLTPLTFDWALDATAPAEFVSAVTAVTDGVGARTEFDYALLPASGAHALEYTEEPFGALISEPTAQPLSSGTERRVVAEMRRPDGLGGFRRTAYQYKGSPLYSTQNRGFIGFAERRIDRLAVPEYDPGSGTTTNRTLTTYVQQRLNYPFLGRSSQRLQVVDANLAAPVQHQTTAFSQQLLYGGAVTFPIVTQQTARTYEDGVVISAGVNDHDYCFRALSSGTCPGSGTLLEFPTRRTTVQQTGTNMTAGSFTPQFWGDVPDYSVTGEQSSITQQTDFENDALDWVLGFPASRVTTLDAPGETAITRSQQFSRVAGTNAVAAATRFPGDTELELQTSLAYDALGNVTQVTVSGQDVLARTTQIGNFDDGRYPQSITDAELNTTSAIYDHRFGAASAITDVDQNSQLFVYDPFGRTVAAEGSDGTTVSQTVAACSGTLCSAVTWADAVLRVAVTTNNGGTQVAPTERIYLDALGRTVLRETEAFDASDGWVREEIHYDSAGRVTKTSLPYFSNGGMPAYVNRHPDALGRTLLISRPDGGKTQTVYTGSAGTMTVTVTETVVTPGVGTVTRQKQSIFDARGLLANTTDAFGSGNAITTSYDYDSAANLDTVTVDGTQVATMTYNAAGMRQQIDEVNTGTTLFDIDALGRIRAQTDANGNISSFDYDDLDRLTSQTSGTVTSTWTWDPVGGVGQLASRSQGDFTETLSYDAFGRVDQISTAVSVTGFPGNGSYDVDLSYDSAGRLATTSWPSGATFTNVYNARGYLEQVKQGTTVLETTAARDAFGNPVRSEYGNGLATDRSHDILGRVASLRTGPSATPASLQDLEYKWRSNGSLYQRLDKRGSTSTSDDWVETFTYDPLERLTVATTVKSSSTARILNFSYDRTGNLTTKESDVSGDLDVTGYQYDTTNARPHRLTSAVIGGTATTFSYDAAGNITAYNAASGDDTQIDYDNRGQVTQITVGPDMSPTAQDNFWYDPDGDRFLKHASWDNSGSLEETWTLYLLGGTFEALHPVSDPDITLRQQVQVTATVVHKRTVTPTGTTNSIEYQHRDHLGSISVITDAAGSVISNLAYDPFGARRESDWSADISPTVLDQILAAATTTTRGYTDHEHLDRTGFIHMNGRVFDPRIGRFLQPDPIVQSPHFSQNYNRYGYVFNNPLSFTDPSGFCTGSLIGGSAFCVGGAGAFGISSGSSPEFLESDEMALAQDLGLDQFEIELARAFPADTSATDAMIRAELPGIGTGAIIAPLDSNVFRDTIAGRIISAVVGNPIAIFTDNNVNPFTDQVVSLPDLQLAKFELLTLPATLFTPARAGSFVTRGITAKNGLKVDGFTKHGVDRAIGNGADRAGVSPGGIRDALKDPLKIGDVKIDQLGRQSQRFTGRTGEVVVNPQTGKIISVNPTSTKKAERLIRQLENSQ